MIRLKARSMSTTLSIFARLGAHAPQSDAAKRRSRRRAQRYRRFGRATVGWMESGDDVLAIPA
jgi:hypothetical protein